MQRKKSKASVAMMKVLPNELENQPEFDGFTEWLQTFELYRGKQGVEEFEDEGRVVGKFKVSYKLRGHWWENLRKGQIWIFRQNYFGK